MNSIDISGVSAALTESTVAIAAIGVAMIAVAGVALGWRYARGFVWK